MPTNCETEIYQLLNKPLTQHAWNFDQTSNLCTKYDISKILEIAVCPNSENIVIFEKKGSKWIIEDILKEV